MLLIGWAVVIPIVVVTGLYAASVIAGVRIRWTDAININEMAREIVPLGALDSPVAGRRLPAVATRPDSCAPAVGRRPSVIRVGVPTDHADSARTQSCAAGSGGQATATSWPRRRSRS
jgi:hypothetical protein